MTRSLCLILTVATGFAVAGYAAPAQACSCFGSTEVANVGTLAANAGLVLRDFCGGDRSGLSVTVDGAPAEFANLPDNAGSGAPLVTGIVPEPSIGQTVEVTYGNVEFGSENVRVLEVVGPDTEAPAPPSIEIDTDVDPGDLACGGDEAPYAMRITLGDLSEGDSDVRYFVNVTADGEMLFSRSVGRFFTQAELTLTRSQDESFGDFREVCVDVTAIDAAGNESEAVSSCEAGPAAAAGCACHTGVGASPAWSVFALLGLFGLRRSRR